MKLYFSFITVGQILDELEKEGFPIARSTFYRLEKQLNLPSKRTEGGYWRWRRYTREDANGLKKLIKEILYGQINN